MNYNSNGAIKGWIDWGSIQRFPNFINYTTFEVKPKGKDFIAKNGVIFGKGIW
jgi:hypothetical protein